MIESGCQCQRRSRGATSTRPPTVDYFYMRPPRTSDSSTAQSPFSISRLRYPGPDDPRRDDATTYYRCEPAVAPPPKPQVGVRWKHARESPSGIGDLGAFKPARDKQGVDEWIDEQIHLTDRSNYEQRAQPMGKEELRQRMWDELVYEYEAEAHKWMKHEAEMRRRAREREGEREEARRRIVQEDIKKIQARVRQRRDSERQAIAEERRRGVEKAREKARKDQVRAERAMLEAWNAHESRWAAISASSERLGFRDVPWPLLCAPERVADVTPEGITDFLLHPAHSSGQSRRERVRTALLRWHPDRFRRILVRAVEPERAMVEEAVGVVARCLNQLLAKEGKTLQQVSLQK